MDLREKVSSTLKTKNQCMSVEVFDNLVESGLLRDIDPNVLSLLKIVKQQQELIDQLIKDADKHD